MRLLSLLLVAVGFVGDDETSVSIGASDIDRLQGTWIVSFVAGADQFLPEALRDASWSFVGDSLSSRSADGRDWPSRQFRLHPIKRPRAIDFGHAVRPDPDGKFAAFEGIYELDGERLRICL